MAEGGDAAIAAASMTRGAEAGAAPICTNKQQTALSLGGAGGEPPARLPSSAHGRCG